MVESSEGIGGRKWSLLTTDTEVTGVVVMEGKKPIAALTLNGEAVKHLLVTAPQLWAAANEMLRLIEAAAVKIANGTHEADDDVRVRYATHELRNIVAKAVGKTDWNDVLQATPTSNR